MTTERLTLTPLTVADAAGMLAVYADERMYTFTGGQPLDAEHLCARYEHLALGWNHDRSDRWLNWIVRLRGLDDPIGAMQATVAVDRSQASVAWEIAVGRWGNGYASEAAGEMVNWLCRLGVARMSASIHPDHHASGAVARHLGFAPTDELDDGEVVWALAGPDLRDDVSVRSQGR